MTEKKKPTEQEQAELKPAELETLSPAAELEARDATIAELKAELNRIRETPAGANDEMGKALAALAAEVERMKAGTGLVPVPETGEPDPELYWARLANGDVIGLQHPHATHHYTESHGLVPVVDVWVKDPATV